MDRIFSLASSKVNITVAKKNTARAKCVGEKAAATMGRNLNRCTGSDREARAWDAWISIRSSKSCTPFPLPTATKYLRSERHKDTGSDRATALGANRRGIGFRFSCGDEGTYSSSEVSVTTTMTNPSCDQAYKETG